MNPRYHILPPFKPSFQSVVLSKWIHRTTRYYDDFGQRNVAFLAPFMFWMVVLDALSLVCPTRYFPTLGLFIVLFNIYALIPILFNCTSWYWPFPRNLMTWCYKVGDLLCRRVVYGVHPWPEDKEGKERAMIFVGLQMLITIAIYIIILISDISVAIFAPKSFSDSDGYYLTARTLTISVTMFFFMVIHVARMLRSDTKPPKRRRKVVVDSKEEATLPSGVTINS